MMLRGEVHIWTASQRTDCACHLFSCLNSLEHARANRYRLAKDRWAFMFARGVLRDVLSRYLHCRPKDLEFTANAYGKPCLTKTAASRGLEFNLSHAGSLVVVAVSEGRCIGVDVEHIRPISDFSSIAESYFTPDECTFIFHHEPSEQEWAFFRCWTRKEAYVKAVGKGLSMPLNSFDTLIPSGKAGLQISGIPDAPQVATWWLADVDVPENYLGAVVAEARIERLLYVDWRPERCVPT